MDPEVTPEPQKDDENPSRVHMSSLLLFVRQSQAEHGLKHNDYTRYRHHCTRQLRKLYSGLGLQHGRGRYVKKDISPDHCFSDRHLHVLLISAERAWSTAMALKHRGQGMSSGERHYMLMRFRKAELWSRKLADAALRRYEPKIALEAEAYSSWITGNFLIETGKDMRGSLVSLLRAKAVLEELVRSRNMENLGVCKQYLEELHPKIRFCRYEMERAGSQGDQTDGDDLGSDLKALVTELQAQGEGEVRSRASSGAVFDWRGMSFPIVHEKVSQSISAADGAFQSAKDCASAGDAGALQKFDRAVQLYNEGLHAVEAADSTGELVTEAQEDAQLLRHAVKGKAAEAKLARVEHLVQLSVQQMRLKQMRALGWRTASADASQDPGPASSKKKRKQRPARAEDLVRLYDSMDVVLRELSEVANNLPAAQNEQLVEECSVRATLAKAGQLLYLARAGIHRQKFASAVEAAKSALSVAREGAGQAEGTAGVADVARALATMQQESQVVMVEAVAEWHRIASAKSDAVSVAGLSISAGQAQAQEQAPGDKAHSWKAFVRAGAVPALPDTEPTPVTMPMRPFTLDAALNYVQFPELQHLYTEPKEAKSSLARLFRWS